MGEGGTYTRASVQDFRVRSKSSAYTLPRLCPNASGGVSVCSCCSLSSTGLGVKSQSTRFLETTANVSSSYTTLGTTADHQTALPGRRPSGPAPKYTPVHKYHTPSEPALTTSGTLLLPVACFEPQNISDRAKNLTSYLCPWPCSVNDLIDTDVTGQAAAYLATQKGCRIKTRRSP